MANTKAKGVPHHSRGGYLEALLNSCPSAILAINAEGIITFANKETCNLVGCGMEGIIGENISTIYENPELARETNRKLYVSGGIIRDHESRIKARDGRIVPVRISASHLKDSSGNYIGAVGYFEKYRPWTKAETDLKTYAEDLEAKLQEWRDLGAPVFELYPRLTAVAVIGRLDSERFTRINTTILDHVKAKKSQVVLIDLGAALTENEVAPQLVKTIRTVQLLGAQCVLSDIQTSIAQEIAEIMPDMGPVKAFSSTKFALEAALDMLDYSITKKS